jgi:NADP-dependent 3-hydroxy acid dehydrogenase YdfG
MGRDAHLLLTHEQESVLEAELAQLQREILFATLSLTTISFSTCISHAFAKEGYSIALISRRAEDLKKFEDELKAAGAEVRNKRPATMRISF